MRRATLLLVCATGVFPSSYARAQVAPTKSVLAINCQAVDGHTGLPLRGVSVVVRSVAFAGDTDSLGWVRIPVPEEGAYFLELAKEGYEGKAGVVQVGGVANAVVELDPVLADPGPERSTVVGEVRDVQSGKPLQGVEVRVDGEGVRTISGDAGEFVLEPLGAGTYHLTFVRLGYAQRDVLLPLALGQRAEMMVPMAMAPIPLPPVEVTVERRSVVLETAGFYRRRGLGAGQFLSIDQIEKRPATSVSELFNDLRGIMFMDHHDGGREEAVAFVRGQGVVGSVNGKPRRICYPAVWLDGTQVASGGDQPAVLNRYVGPTDIVGIEAYSSAAQVPLQYSGTGRACGVILVWTKG